VKKKVNQRVRLSARVDGKKDRNANEMRIQNVAIIMRSWRDLLKRRWITIILLSSITMTKACDRATQRCCLSTLYPHMARGNISCRQHRACCVALCGVVWCGVVWCGAVWCCVLCAVSNGHSPRHLQPSSQPSTCQPAVDLLKHWLRIWDLIPTT